MDGKLSCTFLSHYGRLTFFSLFYVLIGLCFTYLKHGFMLDVDRSRDRE